MRGKISSGVSYVGLADGALDSSEVLLSQVFFKPWTVVCSSKDKISVLKGNKIDVGQRTYEEMHVLSHFFPLALVTKTFNVTQGYFNNTVHLGFAISLRHRGYGR